METLTSTQLLKRIRSATSDLSELRESKSVQLKFWNAIRSLDLDILQWFWSMGSSTRHQVMNVDAYEHGLQYGFTEIKFCEYGWLDNRDWILTEELHFKLKEDKAYYNRITLSCGINGSWAYGLSYNYGTGSGGGWAPSIYDKPFLSREACLNAALDDLKDKMEHTITRATAHPDPSNYNISYMNKIVQLIQKEYASQVQLTLF